MRSGKWRRKSPSQPPQGISKDSLGRMRVHDNDYMAALHQAAIKPLDLGSGIPPLGIMELHHTAPPVKGKRRRDFDSSVVPLDKADHQAIEMNALEEKQFGRLFALWSIYQYWCYKHKESGDAESARRFHSWVLENMLCPASGVE